MRRFLIATDFSAAARNASQYGILLAKAFNGSVTLVNAYQQVPVIVTEPLIFVEPNRGALAVQKLEEEAVVLNSENAASVDISARQGPNANAILEVAREIQADLIIAGMKGSGRPTRRFFGSTVTSLAGKTTCPMLVIPEETRYKVPKTIAFANDLSSQAGTHLLDALDELIERFHSKLYIVRVITKRSDEVVEILTRPPNLNEMVGKWEPLYEYPLDNHISRALEAFISTHSIDMLVMIPHKESIPERWFLRSNTREMLFRTNIPLLILPDAPHKGKHEHSVVF